MNNILDLSDVCGTTKIKDIKINENIKNEKMKIIESIKKIIGIYDFKYFHDILNEINILYAKNKKTNILLNVIGKLLIRSICVAASFRPNKFRKLKKGETITSAKQNDIKKIRDKFEVIGKSCKASMSFKLYIKKIVNDLLYINFELDGCKLIYSNNNLNKLISIFKIIKKCITFDLTQNSMLLTYKKTNVDNSDIKIKYILELMGSVSKNIVMNIITNNDRDLLEFVINKKGLTFDKFVENHGIIKGNHYQIYLNILENIFNLTNDLEYILFCILKVSEATQKFNNYNLFLKFIDIYEFISNDKCLVILDNTSDMISIVNKKEIINKIRQNIYEDIKKIIINTKFKQLISIIRYCCINIDKTILKDHNIIFMKNIVNYIFENKFMNASHKSYVTNINLIVGVLKNVCAVQNINVNFMIEMIDKCKNINLISTFEISNKCKNIRMISEIDKYICYWILEYYNNSEIDNFNLLDMIILKYPHNEYYYGMAIVNILYQFDDEGDEDTGYQKTNYFFDHFKKYIKTHIFIEKFITYYETYIYRHHEISASKINIFLLVINFFPDLILSNLCSIVCKLIKIFFEKILIEHFDIEIICIESLIDNIFAAMKHYNINIENDIIIRGFLYYFGVTFIKYDKIRTVNEIKAANNVKNLIIIKKISSDNFCPNIVDKFYMQYKSILKPIVWKIVSFYKSNYNNKPLNNSNVQINGWLIYKDFLKFEDRDNCLIKINNHAISELNMLDTHTHNDDNIYDKCDYTNENVCENIYDMICMICLGTADSKLKICSHPICEKCFILWYLIYGKTLRCCLCSKKIL